MPILSKPDNAETTSQQDEHPTELVERVAYSYVNFANARISKYDFRLAFANRRSEENVEPVAGLVMSHIHAKELRDLLNRMISTLEDAMGPIDDPSERILAFNKTQQERKDGNHDE